MKYLIKGVLLNFAILITFSCKQQVQNENIVELNSLIIRISEIEIEPNYLDEYISILKEESEASVRLESGVISIFPMFQKENPTEIRILEIYASKEAYKSHLQTPHFKHYKTSTLKMVKSLRLVDMDAIDAETMPEIFRKIKSN
ncbi:putative quinol monooxygenase [Gaoshiqia sediminis]|uniref:Antibiotic biosynthesis monooxygenase n=1 Tax=Gaoshiqia sediminis TaxID=2986998 RepID=A0AA41YDX0_9BACT|nr:antibiotic biosynthesis monooxygenase [Gaoshiqia sediminis]MCW0485005.1 antibiotic biosynthesis monooxygenase [Gaoshiqia sediminis]